MTSAIQPVSSNQYSVSSNQYSKLTPIVASNSSKLIVNCCKYLTAGLAYSAVTTSINASLVKDLCLSTPEFITAYAKTATYITNSFPFWNSSFEHAVLKAPLFHGLFFRVLLQDNLLRRLPKALLRQFAPSYTAIVDEKAIKIARVLTSGLLYSLAYASTSCGSTIRHVNMFALGTFLAGIQEYTESPLMAMLFHSGNNLLILYKKPDIVL